tara:strand:+ start:111 stop:992 length:882 start_codon:yes stop_codon:yes gene_type:complete
MLNQGQKILLKLPKPLAKLAKAAFTYPRYWACLGKARKGYRQFGGRYEHSVLFVAGMPKSGTTWVEQMLSSFSGYEAVLIPEATFSELRTGEGHCFEMPNDGVSRFSQMLVLTKMHVPGTENNSRILKDSNVPCLILHRDLRDVSISHYYYVRNTPWHGDYNALRNATIEEGVDYFIRNRLEEFICWIDGWERWRDPNNSVLVRYEDLLDDTRSSMKQVLSLFGLPADEDQLRSIVEAHDFKSLRAKNVTTGFFRKGTSGDWHNHYTSDLKELFKQFSGDYLIRYGYESNVDW